MRDVLLDKNTGSKKLRRACQSEGVVNCHLLPLSLRDEDDPVVHDYAWRKNTLLVTNDRRLWTESYGRIADRTHGVLLVFIDEQSAGKVRFMTWKETQRILHQFKRGFPDWHDVNWEGHILELSNTGVQLIRALSPEPKILQLLNFQMDGWQQRLRDQFLGSRD